MERTKGRFSASTLKHVPHDQDDNDFPDDQGCSCGPWVFAMYRYIFANPHFLTRANGLKGAFARSQLARHRRQLGFNSRENRIAMQDLIQAAAQESLSTNLLPFGVDVPILMILDGIHRDIILNDLFRFLGQPSANVPRPKGKPSGGNDGDDNNDGDDDGGDIPLAELQKLINKDPKTYQALPKEDQLRLAREIILTIQRSQFDALEAARKRAAGDSFNLAEALQDHYAAFVDMDLKVIAEFVANDPIGELLHKDQDEWLQRTILQHTFGDFDRLTPAEITSWREKDPRLAKTLTSAEVVAQLMDYVKHIGTRNVRGKSQYYPTSYTDPLTVKLIAAAAQDAKNRKKGWPVGAKNVPNFAHASEEETAPWMLFTTKQPDHNSVTDRAILHIHLKKTFRRETKRDLIEYWSQDGALFNEPERKRNLTEADADEVLRRLRDHYEQLAVQVEKSAAEREAKHKAKKARCSKPASKQSGRRKVTDDLESGKDPKHPRTGVDNIPNNKIPGNPSDCDWCQLTEDALQFFLTKLILESPKIKGRSTISWTHRAILFVKHGGYFKDESKERLQRFWSKDDNAFTVGRLRKAGIDIMCDKDENGAHRRTITLSVGEMRKRLEDTYETGPIDASSESSEGSEEDPSDPRPGQPGTG